MKTQSIRFAIGLGVVCMLVFFSCSKNSSSGSNANIPAGKSQVSVYMMDAPVSFYKVLIDIRQVVVEVDTATQQNTPDNNDQWADNYCGRGRNQNDKSVIWDTLAITHGVYNLLDLRNGTDTLLGAGLYTTGKILKIKITLGAQDTVYTDSATWYPMAVWGPSPSFTINVQRQNVSSVTNNEFELWLDFNLQRSVFFWDGRFLLDPYITVFNYRQSAKIRGQVGPRGGDVALVTAYNAADTFYAIPGWNGNYQMNNVAAGTYSINFKGRNGYKDTTISPIAVDSMKTTNVQTITLHK